MFGARPRMETAGFEFNGWMLEPSSLILSLNVGPRPFLVSFFCLYGPLCFTMSVISVTAG